jgi:nitroreductase
MTQLTGQNEAVQVLLSRHSVRKYKPDHEIPQETLHTILDITRHAPSAWNLQHWKLLIIQEAADKEKLLPIAYNQKQVVDSSVTIAILGDTQANKNAETVYNQSVQAGYIPAAIAEAQVGRINDAYEKMGEEFGRHHAKLNAGLVSMQLMLAAKALGYDSIPMSGFDADQLAEQFNVDSRYIPLMLVSIGLSDEPPHETPKLPVEDIIYKNS